MVCSNHFKVKYARFLIKYYLFIYFFITVMTSISISFLLYKHDIKNHDHLLRGFQVHGTTLSENYRTLISFMRATQIAHLYPRLINGKEFQQIPYQSFNPHTNPCTKRFYLSKCPILPYIELTFEFNNNHTQIFNDLNAFKSICKLELYLLSTYTNCSINHTCCHFIGPLGLIFNDKLISYELCDNLTENELNEYYERWTSCQLSSSSCINKNFETYLKYLESHSVFKIYLSIDNNETYLLQFYNYIKHLKYEQNYYLKFINFDINDEGIILNYVLMNNSYLILISIIIYLICLILFVKNFFFIFTIIIHILSTFISCFMVYHYLFKFPITILNITSLILSLFLILIDSFLWYTCWFIHKHRRDDCTIQRIMENLLTQTFFYIMPKNLTAITILVITYTNQIITIQYFTLYSFLLIIISFFISFVLYPASFVFIIRFQSSIPTIEHFLRHSLKNTASCFIDRAIPYLIVRLKVLWLISLAFISCFSLFIIFYKPKLQFDVCQLTFDTIPNRMSNTRHENSINNLDVDVTYYIGSKWEAPKESFVPSNDFSVFDYNTESKVTSSADGNDTFAYALKVNLAQIMEFCSLFQHKVKKRTLTNVDSYSYEKKQELNNDSILSVSSLTNKTNNLNQVSFQCFGDLFLSNSETMPPIYTKFTPYIQYQSNTTLNCTSLCLSNQLNETHECILCLNKNYYLSKMYDDLFIIKNGLRFASDGQNPRYLLQTINYNWKIKTNINNYTEWNIFIDQLKENSVENFYRETFTQNLVWWTSEIFSTFSILEQLQREKFLLIPIKFLVIFIFLMLFTGVLGIFVTLTTFLNFLTCMATFALLNYKLTVENLSHFVIVLIISTQYSVLYSISYKLAPTFFFQRENRTMYSLKQLSTTLLHLTLSIVIIFTPCLFSSMPYLAKSAMIYIISTILSFIYSTFFLQSLLCYFGPAEHPCRIMSWRFSVKNNMNIHKNPMNNKDISLRRSSTNGGRRHHRMSTSSYLASSYFSQIFTGSTYFESEFTGINESNTNTSRRRESARSYQVSHPTKRISSLTGELIALYTPRASLAPHSHHTYHHRYSRQSSVTRAIPSTALARPLYVSPSISPYSHSSIQSQITGRQRTPSPRVFRPSRSPSPHSFSPPVPGPVSSTSSLRPCYSAPRLHVPLHRIQIISMKQNDVLIEETSVVEDKSKILKNIRRQDAITTTEDSDLSSPTIKYSQRPAAERRSVLKATETESGDLVWLKRSNSS